MKRADFLKIMSLSALGPFFGRCSEPESGQKMDAAVMQKKWIWSKPDISLDDAHWKRRFDLMRSPASTVSSRGGARGIFLFDDAGMTAEKWAAVGLAIGKARGKR